VEEELQLALEKRRQAVGLRGRGGHVMGGGHVSNGHVVCVHAVLEIPNGAPPGRRGYMPGPNPKARSRIALQIYV
jgi:hypothetical protein